MIVAKKIVEDHPVLQKIPGVKSVFEKNYLEKLTQEEAALAKYRQTLAALPEATGDSELDNQIQRMRSDFAEQKSSLEARLEQFYSYKRVSMFPTAARATTTTEQSPVNPNLPAYAEPGNS